MLNEESLPNEPLRCSYCERRFEKSIRSPRGSRTECRLCEECCDELKDPDEPEKSYMCKSCGKEHLFAQDDEAMVWNEADHNVEKLTRLIGGLEESIKDLKTLNSREVINLYCENLEIEVMETVESAIQHLNKVQDDYLKEISSYRSRLFDSLPDFGISEQPAENKQKTEAIQQLDEFAEKLNEYKESSVSRLKLKSLGAMIFEDELCRLKELQDKAKEMEQQLRNSVLSIEGRILRFKENHLFCLSNEVVGELVYESSKVEDFTKWAVDMYNEPAKYIRFEQPKQILLVNHKVAVVANQSRAVEIYDKNMEKLLFLLNEHQEMISSIVLLPNGWLATASSDRTIKLWTGASNDSLKTITGHTDAILSMVLLKNARLATCGQDDSIRVWNPFAPTYREHLIRTMACYTEKNCLEMSKLSNDFLVTCTPRNEDSVEATIRVWNPEKGTMVRERLTGHSDARRMLVLSNDEIAIGYVDGIVRIFNLTNSNRLLAINCHAEPIELLKELPNFHLQTRSYLEFKVWRLDRGQLVKTILKKP